MTKQGRLRPVLSAGDRLPALKSQAKEVEMGRRIDELEAEVFAARLEKAQKTCPFFLALEEVEGLNDSKLCLYDMSPCEDRRFCPVDKWSAPIR